jgi:hypothetical protein
MYVWDLFQPVLQLLDRQLAVSVNVHFAECVSKVLDLVLGDAGGDKAEGGTLEVDGIHVVLHVDEYVFVYFDIFKFFIALLLDPWVLISFLRR